MSVGLLNALVNTWCVELILRSFYREPVSSEEAEDYLDIISQPMDFQTMLGKFSQGSYRHIQDFLEDVKLVFANAEQYNQHGSTVLSCMVKTEQMFTELLQKLLPGHSYLRRRSRKRVNLAPATSEEEDEEEEEPKKLQNGKSNRRKARSSRRRKNEESESEEEEEDDDDQEEDGEEEEEDDGRRRSKRTSTTSGRKDYREQDSDGDRDTQRTRQRRGRGNAGGASSDEDRSSQQRHSKRPKRS